MKTVTNIEELKDVIPDFVIKLYLILSVHTQITVEKII